MATVKQYLRNLKEFRTTILDVQEQAVYANEKEITVLNVQNIEHHISSDGGLLQNDNKLFAGRYTLFTQMLNPMKVAGTPYNFVNTGQFVSNFQIELDSSITKIRIYSTGEGSGSKQAFFKGYRNLYGLTKENQLWLNNEIMKALQTQARKYI